MPALSAPTPFNPGDYDREVSAYAEVLVLAFEFSLPEAMSRVTYQYGNTVGGVWRPGKLLVEYLTLTGVDFWAAVQRNPQAYGLTAAAVEQELIAHLVATAQPSTTERVTNVEADEGLAVVSSLEAEVQTTASATWLQRLRALLEV
jgi:hypothetical protein